MKYLNKWLPKFYLKVGIFGDCGWKQVSFLKWLYYADNHVNKIRFNN